MLGIIIVILFGNISLDSYNSILLLMGNYKIYMSIILSIISYIYLFYNKSIKYLIPLTSIGIYFIIMLLVTLFSGNNLYDIFFLVIRLFGWIHWLQENGGNDDREEEWGNEWENREFSKCDRYPLSL